tara:strand:- start:41 stop:784 length:744 start_codon:yes stop_codon:yes gene_type:complete
MLKKKKKLNYNFLIFSKQIIFYGISSIFLALPVLAENKPDFVVSIKQLSYEFERNSIVAEDKYMNKTIKTKGIITSVDDTLLGDRWVGVEIEEPESNSYSPGSITCLHIRSEPIIRELYKGQKVNIIGTIKEEELGLTLKSCSYEEYRTSKDWREIFAKKGFQIYCNPNAETCQIYRKPTYKVNDPKTIVSTKDQYSMDIDCYGLKNGYKEYINDSTLYESSGWRTPNIKNSVFQENEELVAKEVCS